MGWSTGKEAGGAADFFHQDESVFRFSGLGETWGVLFPTEGAGALEEEGGRLKRLRGGQGDGQFSLRALLAVEDRLEFRSLEQLPVEGDTKNILGIIYGKVAGSAKHGTGYQIEHEKIGVGELKLFELLGRFLQGKCELALGIVTSFGFHLV